MPSENQVGPKPEASRDIETWCHRRRSPPHTEADSRRFKTLRVLNKVLRLMPNMEVSSLTSPPALRHTIGVGFAPYYDLADKFDAPTTSYLASFDGYISVRDDTYVWQVTPEGPVLVPTF
jgi:hypothetical protein